jgi:hypothetical protein
LPVWRQKPFGPTQKICSGPPLLHSHPLTLLDENAD